MPRLNRLIMGKPGLTVLRLRSFRGQASAGTKLFLRSVLPSLDFKGTSSSHCFNSNPHSPQQPISWGRGETESNPPASPGCPVPSCKLELGFWNASGNKGSPKLALTGLFDKMEVLAGWWAQSFVILALLQASVSELFNSFKNVLCIRSFAWIKNYHYHHHHNIPDQHNWIFFPLGSQSKLRYP